MTAKDRTDWPSIKRLNFLNIVGADLGQHVPVGSIDFLHGSLAVLLESDVRLVSVFVVDESGKVHDPDSYSGERLAGNIIAVPVAIAQPPLPAAERVQTVTQGFSRTFFADE